MFIGESKILEICGNALTSQSVGPKILWLKKNKPEVLVIVFYFLHEGAHVKTDINNDLKPALEKSNLSKVCITKHLGTDEKMIDLILERAREVEDAN